MSDDPLVDSVRDARKRISERVGHDPRKLIEYYKKLQERHRDRFVKSRFAEPEKSDESAA
jgi:hypothetical protein